MNFNSSQSNRAWLLYYYIKRHNTITKPYFTMGPPTNGTKPKNIKNEAFSLRLILPGYLTASFFWLPAASIGSMLTMRYTIFVV